MDAPIARLMAEALLKGYAAQAEKEEAEKKKETEEGIEELTKEEKAELKVEKEVT